MTRLRWVVGIAAILGVALAAASSAIATTWIRMDLRTASEKSAKILVGEVKAVTGHRMDSSALGADGICTQVTVRLERRLKGFKPEDESFSFWVPGGVVGSEVWDVAGAPWFRPGDRALLFLFEDEKEKGMYWPYWGAALPITRTGVVVGRPSYTLESNMRLDEVVAQIDRFVKEGR